MRIFACIKNVEVVEMVSYDKGLAEAGLNDGTFDKVVEFETDLNYNEIAEIFNGEIQFVTVEDLKKD